MMSSTTHASELFEKLRPICVEIAREPTSCRIDMLQNYMQSNGSTDFSMLTEYILFPLQATVARKNTSIKLKIQAIGCMCVLLSRINLVRFDIFQQIFKRVCFFLSSKEPGEASQELSEDSKEVLLDCTLILLDSSSNDVLKSIYKDDFMPSLGHCISLLLNVAVKERAKHLAVKAINCIKKFAINLNADGRKSDQNMTYYNVLSIKLASFLPGISISLSKAVTSDIKQGRNVIIAAIKAWTAHIQVVMDNKFYPSAKSTDAVDELTQIMSTLMPSKKSGTMMDEAEQKEKKSLEVKKDKEWYSKTDAKLKVLIERVSNLTSHSSWKVRLTMLEFADVLLKKCSKSLATCVPCLFEIVIGLSSDEYVEVSQKSKTIISELNKLLPEQTPIIEIIEENLYAYFTSLPRQIRDTNEGMKLRSLRIIVGYLRVLGDNMKNTFNADHLLKRIYQALIQVLEFDLSDIRIVEQKSQQDSESNFDVALNCIDELNSCQFIYKKKFKHFRDERLLSLIVKICWYLGRYGNILLLVDQLLDMFRSSSVNRKQVVVLINEIVRGSVRNLDHDVSRQENLPKECVDNVRACVKLVLSEYLSKDIWNVRISNDENEDLKTSLQKEDLFMLPSSQAMHRKPVSFHQLNSNIQLLCLVLEGIGIFATVLREYFESMLLEVLYPLMEKLGSRNATVSQVAYWSLSTIAVCCKYNSTEELIAKNVDYLINSISLNLRHINLNPHTPAVLNAMLQYGDKLLIPFLEDTFDEVLSLVDYSDDNLLLSLLKVLHSLTLALNKWFPVEVSKENRKCEKKSVQKFAKNTDLREFFIAQLKLKKESLGEVSNDDIELPEGENEQEMVDEDKVEVKEVALYVKFTIKVLEKCSYFLTSKFVRIRLVMLDTTQHGVLVLSNTEDHLLPMIHKLWQPMTKCFSDDELVVRTKAVSVLETMVNTSGQFMRRRVIKDAFPTFISYLEMQQSVSGKAGAIYTHTLGFKFQLAILNVLGTICHDLEVTDVECGKVISSIIPYLSQRQPQILQQAAVDVMRILMKLEPDLVWLSLNNVFCPIVPVLPQQCSPFAFTDVQFAGFHSDKNCEFAANVKKLLGS